MSMSVITNVASLNAQRNLSTNSVQLSKSLERLSSGFRINRAGDDAAGLAISEGLRAQVRGLNQAIRNANDGLSLVATAEGALAESTSLVQRIRELAVQAANGTNSDANRAAIQNEVDNLLSEFDRIGNTTEFNNRNLLDGSFTGIDLQVGANKGQTIEVNVGEVRASNIGAIAEVTGTAITAAAAGDVDEININTETLVLDAADDALSTAENESSAIALAAAVNAVSGSTGVEAEVNATVHTGGASLAAGTLNSTNSLTINDVAINATVLDATDSDGALQEAINAVSNQTGVTASVSGNNLVLTAEDGRNIEVVTAGTGGTTSGLTADVYHGSVTLVSDSSITVGGADIANVGFTAGGTAVDLSTAINSVDLTTIAGAQDAIRTADFALTQIGDIRSELGAITNRLESTISNLATTAENLSASESRIRDTDFAAETANLTRSQILQQAGVAILAQANVSSQAALSLIG